MAVILTEGFDHFSAAQAADKFWNGTIFQIVSGRGFGGQAIVLVDNNPLEKQLPASYSTLIAGAAFKISSPVGAGGSFMRLLASGGVVGYVGIDSNQHLTLYGAAANLVATGTTIVPLAEWIYVELKIVVGGSGSGEIHLNGVSEIASTGGNFGSSNINQIEFDSTWPSGDLTVDDVYIVDTSGSSPQNTFLGDVRVETLYPVADGTHTDWTPKIAGPHYQMVNEHDMDEDGTFVYDANAGDKDSYVMDTFLNTIYAAQLNVAARKGDVSVRQIAPLVRQAGTDHVGSTFTLTSDYLFYSWLLSKDPTGADWLPATVNADEFGQELIA